MQDHARLGRSRSAALDAYLARAEQLDGMVQTYWADHQWTKASVAFTATCMVRAAADAEAREGIDPPEPKVERVA